MKIGFLFPGQGAQVIGMGKDLYERYEEVRKIYDKEIIKNVYNVEKIEDINKVILEKIKEINAQIPKYKAIRGMILTEEPLIKTTTNKIKRQANLDRINAELQR